jgi:natural product biosynthesis luciferase-like monooxygenase protein
VLRCYLMGQESLLIQCAETLLDKGHQICGVITDTDQLVQWAQGRGLAVLEPGKGLAERVSEPHDYFFSIANLRVVEPAVFTKAEKGAINFHDGPLPRYAGLYATAWAVMGQEESHGITWHAMTEQLDAGEILLQRTFDLRPGETSFTLNTHCYQLAIETFGELVEQLDAGTNEPSAQPAADKHYFGREKRPAAAGRLDWRKSAAELEALVRGLDFGPVDNPLALAKITLANGSVAMVGEASSTSPEDDKSAEPGTITAIDEASLSVATSAGDVVLGKLRSGNNGQGSALGKEIVPSSWLAEQGVAVGDVLPALDDETAARVTDVHESLSRDESFWTRRLATFAAPDVPYADRSGTPQGATASADLALPAGADALGGDGLVAAVAAYLARIADSDDCMLSYRDPGLADALKGAESSFASHVPLRLRPDRSAGFAAWRQTLSKELERVRKRKSYARDAVLRHASMAARADAIASALERVKIEQVADVAAHAAGPGVELAVAVAADGKACRWLHDPAVYSAETIATMQAQLVALLGAALADGARPLGELPILPEDERKRLLVDHNATAADYPRDACIHSLFEARVAERPDAPALAYLDEASSYAELNARANQLARHLRDQGVGPDVLVGVCIERSSDMLVAALAVMKAGGAYVPMDPSYPRERLALMLEDSKVAVLVTQARLLTHLPEHSAKAVVIDDDWATIAGHASGDLAPLAKPDNLAYCIYTSGSTGRPKGVMVEHRNAVNFFTGMDQRLGHEPGKSEPGVWLALTSLSFDISVLELFWTLARGFKVVLHTDKADEAAFARSKQQHADKNITFSLMYFASDEGENASSADKYKLLLEGAKFGDRNGFEAVWTPERHFHAFGGLYPNPSVASAALATITERIHLRSASVVSPLHHPIRIAEEWSLVDNLSQGRVGISFAAGWQPNDFIIRNPELFKDRKKVMLEEVETVRALWRGEKFKATSPLGREIEVQTLPRPVQKELPFWLTAAGNPDTFRAAGECGANLLTHMLGQSADELDEKIKIYRQARKDAGHEGPGRVTLMLHTFIGADEADVKETVREPMKQYLKSSLNLIKLAAWSFPTFKKQADATGKTPEQIFEEKELSDEEMDSLLEHSFERYYKSSGLFGTPARCLEFVDTLKGIDIDEIGCLLDYGVPSAKVLAHLSYLNELKKLSENLGAADYSMAAQIERHGVTHLQCTPSQMTMVLAGDDSRAAIAKVGKVLVGGEAFPAALAKDLRAAAPESTVINMYGPTETTIWSSTQVVRGDEDNIAIGRPIANTQIYILDRHRQPVPGGVAGELWIAGDGVVRGYFERPELTEERFMPDPFRQGGRMYRSGDLARFGADGVIEFLGRVDFQVKIRGYRIELGEIEAFLAADAAVREAVVIAREDSPGDKRLVAYLVAAGELDTKALRDAVAEKLPSYMVPSAFVVLDRFPQTPNRKVDRNALPAPEQAEVKSSAEYVQPDGEIEQSIATVWREVLNVSKVGMDDNFFDLGGHSLLTVQVHRKLKDAIEAELALTDLFRFPTIRSLVSFLQSDGGASGTEQGKDRAAARKEAMARRAKLRDRRRRRR